jgi:holo-[acyl-carrier protein] synthase
MADAHSLDLTDRRLMQSHRFQDLAALARAGDRLRVGLDVVDIRRVSDSIDRFGDRFVRRLFSEAEISYAHAGEGRTAERLAARFAAKEAAIKAFDLAEAGVNWRDIEVEKLNDGACRLALHGRAAAQAQRLGVRDIALSLSHDGDYAAAVVTALLLPSRDETGAGAPLSQRN